MTPIWERVLLSPDHTRGSFRDHLECTASLLEQWGQRRTLQQAARYHAVYGNPEGRGAICDPASGELAAEIGNEAEYLVRLWSGLDKLSIVRAVPQYERGDDRVQLQRVDVGPMNVEREIYLDLAHLHAANAVEMASRLHQRSLYEDAHLLSTVVCPKASETLHQYAPGLLRRTVGRLRETLRDLFRRLP